MDKETLDCLPLDQGDPFGHGNEAIIGNFIGRFCDSEEISQLTLQSFSMNSQISENFPIGYPHPGHFGSDRAIRVLASQPVGQESNKSSLSDPETGSASDRIQTTISNSRKRKSNSASNGKESPVSSSLTASNSKISEEKSASMAAKRAKQDEVKSAKDINGGCKDVKAAEPLKDYIHVRARRGQATDSHSLAERARREKISERMKLLQDIVPGCNRITGKAVMLDEIINYVQSLQRQVEFLSMKLSTMNPRMELNANALLSSQMFESSEALLQHSIYPIASSDSRLPSGYLSLGKNIPRFSDSQLPLNSLNVSSLPSIDGFVQPETAAYWGNDLQSIVQMGFGDRQLQNISGCCEGEAVHMKTEE